MTSAYEGMGQERRGNEEGTEVDRSSQCLGENTYLLAILPVTSDVGEHPWV